MYNSIINDTNSRYGSFGAYRYSKDAVFRAYKNFTPLNIKFTHKCDPLLTKIGLNSVGTVESVVYDKESDSIRIKDYNITHPIVKDLLDKKELPALSIEGEIIKSHTEDGIIVVDDFNLSNISIVDKPACKACKINYSDDVELASLSEEEKVSDSTIITINSINYELEENTMVKEETKKEEIVESEVKDISEEETIIHKIKSLLKIEEKEPEVEVISITEEEFKAKIDAEIIPIKEEMVKITEELAKTTEALKLSVSEQERLEKQNSELSTVISSIKEGKVDISEERVSDASIDVAAQEAEAQGFTEAYVKGV